MLLSWIRRPGGIGKFIELVLGNGIDVVGDFSSGECDIQPGPIDVVVDYRAGAVHGAALGAVDGSSIT